MAYELCDATSYSSFSFLTLKRKLKYGLPLYVLILLVLHFSLNLYFMLNTLIMIDMNIFIQDHTVYEIDLQKPFFSNFGAIVTFAIFGTFIASFVTGILVSVLFPLVVQYCIQVPNILSNIGMQMLLLQSLCWCFFAAGFLVALLTSCTNFLLLSVWCLALLFRQLTLSLFCPYFRWSSCFYNVLYYCTCRR